MGGTYERLGFGGDVVQNTRHGDASAGSTSREPIIMPLEVPNVK